MPCRWVGRSPAVITVGPAPVAPVVAAPAIAVLAPLPRATRWRAGARFNVQYSGKNN